MCHTQQLFSLICQLLFKTVQQKYVTKLLKVSQAQIVCGLMYSLTTVLCRLESHVLTGQNAHAKRPLGKSLMVVVKWSLWLPSTLTL